jgi:succinyl-CoA synthetase alpha subunit
MGDALTKMTRLREAGARVAETPAGVAEAVAQVMGR